MSSSIEPSTGPRLRQSLLWNYAGHFFQIAINLALTSVLARHLTVPEYGIFLFVMALTNTLYVLDIGISSVLVQLFVSASARAQKDELHDLLSTAFLVLSALGLLAVAIFATIAAALPGPFAIPRNLLSEARLIFLLGALMIQVALPTMAIEMAYQAAHRFDRLNQTQLVAAILQLGLSIVALAAGYGIVMLAAIQLACIVLRSSALVLGLPRAVPGVYLSLRSFRMNLLWPMLQLSRWAFLNNLGSAGFDFLIWTMLGSLGSMRDVALFGLAGKLPRQLWNLIDRGATVVLPVLSKAVAENDASLIRKTYLRTLQMLFGSTLPFVLLGCFAAKPILTVWAGAQYAEAAPVMQLLLLGVISHANGYASSQLMLACQEVKRASLIAVAEYLMCLSVAIPLLKSHGVVGLAAGMVAAQLLVNFGWLTWAACRLSHTSPAAILRAMTTGVALPGAVLISSMTLIALFDSSWAPLTIFIACVACGCLYLCIWGARSVLPVYRAQSETAA